jgi:hypothetical protein
MVENTSEDYFEGELEADNKNDLKDSLAFREYHTESKGVKRNWKIIILVGISTGLLSVGTYLFAVLALENPYALNFVISLYGIPAGFVIGITNSHFTLLEDIKDAGLGAVVYVISYYIFGVIAKFAFGGFMNIAYNVIGLLFNALMILLFCLLFSFSLGALLACWLENYRRGSKK